MSNIGDISSICNTGRKRQDLNNERMPKGEASTGSGRIKGQREERISSDDSFSPWIQLYLKSVTLGLFSYLSINFFLGLSQFESLSTEKFLTYTALNFLEKKKENETQKEKRRKMSWGRRISVEWVYSISFAR